jgi:hypothetical protein
MGMMIKKKSEWQVEPSGTGLYRVCNKNGVTFWAYYTDRMPHIQLFGSAARVAVGFIVRWLGPYEEPEAPKEGG